MKVIDEEVDTADIDTFLKFFVKWERENSRRITGQGKFRRFSEFSFV